MHGQEKPQSRAPEPRALTDEERALIEWMLRDSGREQFIEHLDRATVVSGCDCGCASISLEIDGYPLPTAGLRIIADYLFGEGDTLQGAFVFEREGVLRGLEVYGLSTEAPKRLPTPAALRPWHEGD